MNPVPDKVLLTSLDTGDVVLVDSRSLSTYPLKIIQATCFDHVALVVRRPSNQRSEPTDAHNSSPNGDTRAEKELFLLEVTAGDGVVMTPLISRLSRIPARHLTIRRLMGVERTENLVTSMYSFAQSLVGVPYQRNWVNMVNARIDIRKNIPAIKLLQDEHKRNLDSVFCSKLVAAALTHMNVLPQHPPAHEYMVTDFTQQRGKVNQVMVRGHFGPEIVIFGTPNPLVSRLLSLDVIKLSLAYLILSVAWHTFAAWRRWASAPAVATRPTLTADQVREGRATLSHVLSFNTTKRERTSDGKIHGRASTREEEEGGGVESMLDRWLDRWAPSTPTLLTPSPSLLMFLMSLRFSRFFPNFEAFHSRM